MQIKQDSTSRQETKPLVSFVITYYNLPVQMLVECIESILQLSLRPFEREIIVIDDGSNESPVNQLMQYEDEIIYLRQKNSGVSMARNKGLDIATGHYIQLVDADDKLLQAPYEQCLDIIRYQEQVDMVLFHFTTHPDVEVIPEVIKPISGAEYMRNNNIHGAAWGYLFSRAILGELRFTQGISYGEDEEFSALLLLRAEKIYPTRYISYYYRKHRMSVTHQQDNAHIQKRLDDTAYVIQRLKQDIDRLSHQDRLAMQRRIAQLTMDYLYQTIMLTHSAKELNSRIKLLHDKGLFPLPNAHYSKKYTWFRHLINSHIGRSILLYTLPLMK